MNRSTSRVIFSLGLFFLGICQASASLWTWLDVERQLEGMYPTISKPALERAFDYLNQHSSEIRNQNYLTIIDFDQPSINERMYVIDLTNLTVNTYLVAHGKESGDLYATTFSNAINSNKSSLGIYWTGSEYIGEHGLSLTLLGKEETNSNAEAREIVLHGADYVSYEFIRQNGRLGRSLGCTAVSLQHSTDLVHKLSGGSVFYIYHSHSE